MKSTKNKPTKRIKTEYKIRTLRDSRGHHPDHSTQLVRLRRIAGQVSGIEKMIQDKRYCLDIITQLKAASSALKAIEAEIFKAHLRSCVKQAFTNDDVFESEEKIQEIIKLIYT